ncbi:23S rRNA accumulation protein YceD [Agaribacter flavus]|uniref:Large ribosomal RNA subunit accumulation protein YceD n=1 Tax=Agaribacter flavus TaxID=1902781 RepID=A0ABV7FR15_9ALTE
MSNVKLPITIDPVKSAQKRASYKGIYQASVMQRLSEAVENILTDVAVDVEFAKDAQSLTYIQGGSRVETSLICQRCNESFSLEISTEFCFSPVQGTEQADALPDVYEPIEVNDHGEIDLLQLVEDELILSLPIVALHAEEDCKQKADDMQFGKIDTDVERENPFAVLKELKRD